MIVINLDELLIRIKKIHLIVFATISIILGFIFNVCNDIRFSIVHEIVLTGLTCSQIIIIKKHIVDMKTVHIETTNTIIHGCFERHNSKQSSICPLALILLVSLFFSICIIALNYLPLSPLGIYGGILGLITLLFGLYGYLQYILSLALLYDIKKRINYSTEYPGKQNWFKKMNQITHRLSTSFLIFGVLYILEYSLLIPNNTIIFHDSNVVLNAHNNILFIISWASILFLIVLAFPILVVIRNHLLKSIIDVWKKDKIEQIQLKTLDAVSKLNTNLDSDNITKISTVIDIYQNLQNTVNNMAVYSITSNTFVIGFTTVLNVSISILTIISQLIELFP